MDEDQARERAPPTPPGVPIAAVAIALVQGLLLWWFLAGMPEGRWPSRDPRVMLPLLLLLAVLPLSLQLLWPFARRRLLQAVLAGGAVFVAVAGALFAATHIEHTAPGTVGRALDRPDDGDLVAGFVLPLAAAWFLAMPLLKLRLAGGRWTGPYPLLFDITWRGALTLAEAALFTGVFWLLLLLAGGLFHLLGIDAVREVVTSPWFALPATTLVGSIAIHLIGASAGMVDGLLRQLLNLLKWLLPLAGLIVIAFTLALLPQLPALYAEGRKALEAFWLLWLLCVTVLLLNAAWQTGERPPGYGRLIEQALRGVPPLLLVIALTALFSLGLRIWSAGLTPMRYWGALVAVVLAAHAAGYTYAARSPDAWFAKLGRVNIAIAVALLAALLLSLTPLADPIRLSVDSQTRRAIAAADDASRDGALRFLAREAGASGRARIDRLAGLADAEGGSAALRAAVPRARRPAGPAVEPFDDWLARIDLVPADRPLDGALVEALRAARSAKDADLRFDAATMLRTDADGDGAEDALLLDVANARFWLFGRAPDGHWRSTAEGRLEGWLDDEGQKALRRGEVAAVAPRLPDLRVGKRRLIPVPNEAP